MKTLTLTLDHFHFSGDISPDMLLMKELHFDLEKPDETIILTLKAPLIGNIRVELDFIHFQNDILTLHILSNRKIADMLLSFMQRYTRNIPFIDVDYPSLRINTVLMMNFLNPGVRIRNIAMVNQQYIVEMEIN
ncbi:MAG: hypothetical protein KAU44_05210 [Candidatus Marinimicrobia bacterium]|nr:hypothetical protein [Candidatus Neomarinimicrobiota bacterium]